MHVLGGRRACHGREDGVGATSTYPLAHVHYHLAPYIRVVTQ